MPVYSEIKTICYMYKISEQPRTIIYSRYTQIIRLYNCWNVLCNKINDIKVCLETRMHKSSFKVFAILHYAIFTKDFHWGKTTLYQSCLVRYCTLAYMLLHPNVYVIRHTSYTGPWFRAISSLYLDPCFSILDLFFYWRKLLRVNLTLIFLSL